MKFQVTFLLLLTISRLVLGGVSPIFLSLEVDKRLEKVPEFKFIQEEANKLGVKVYLFGGTASAFAHYVRWDLEREAGDEKYQAERFDYDFTNIYRGNQDLDIVVDGTAEQAAALQSILKEKYPHFVGSKDAWEVRLLRAEIGDKLPLLDNPDFLNQHTDTNSTGMIAVNAEPGEIVFRDLFSWENPDSVFLNDVAAGRIKFLFSDNHETTSRFKEGKNPPVFAAIRYLAKLAQYEVDEAEGDLEIIKRIVEGANWNTIKNNEYVKHKLEEFGKKVLLNAPDSEYAWNLLEETGLRKRLIEMDGHRFRSHESLSWWMNKEPLRTKPLGEGNGKTAAEIFKDHMNEDGEIIVAHETNSFEAYENITRSSHGAANAFVSRTHANGESAAYGEGFYTRLGLEGAIGSNLTIRFKLSPKARNKKDFIYKHDFVVIKNKAALELVQEDLNISVIDFLILMSNSDISEKDKGFIEKLKRKFGRQNLSKEEVLEVEKLVLGPLNSGGGGVVLSALFSLELDHSKSFILTIFNGMVDYEYFIQYILPNIVDKNIQTEIIKRIMEDSKYDDSLIKHVFKDSERWADSPEFIVKIYNRVREWSSLQLFDYILKNPGWKGIHNNLIHALLEQGYTRGFYSSVLSQDHFDDDTKVMVISTLLDMNYFSSSFVESIIELNKHDEFKTLVARYLATDVGSLLVDTIVQNNKWLVLSPEVLNEFLRYEKFYSSLLKFLIVSYRTDYDNALDYIIPRLSDKNVGVATNVLAMQLGHELELSYGRDKYKCDMLPLCSLKELPLWLKKLLADKGGAIKVLEKINTSAFQDQLDYKVIRDHMINDQDMDPLLIRYLIFPYVKSEQTHRTEFKEAVEVILSRFTAHKEIAQFLLAYEYFKDREDILDSLVKAGEADGEIARYVLSKSFWKGSDAFVNVLVERGSADREIMQYVLNKNHFSIENKEKWIDVILERGNADDLFVEFLLKKNKVVAKSKWIDLILSRGEVGDFSNILLNDDGGYSENPELIKTFVENSPEGATSIVMSKINDPEVFRDLAFRLIKKQPTAIYKLLESLHLKGDLWIDYIEVIKEALKVDMIEVKMGLAEFIFPHKYWADHSDLVVSALNGQHSEATIIEFINLVLENKHWWGFNGRDVLLKLFSMNEPGNLAFEDITIGASAARYYLGAAERIDTDAAISLTSEELVLALLELKEEGVDRRLISYIGLPSMYKYAHTILPLFSDSRYQYNIITSLYDEVERDDYYNVDWLIETFKKSYVNTQSRILSVFSKEYYAINHHGFISNLIDESDEYDYNIVKYLLNSPRWARHSYLIKKIISKGDRSKEAVVLAIENVLSMKEWTAFPEIIEDFILRGEYVSHVRNYVLSKPAWAVHPDLLIRLIMRNESKKTVENRVLSKKHWKEHPLFLDFFGEEVQVNFDLIFSNAEELLARYYNSIGVSQLSAEEISFDSVKHQCSRILQSL